MGTPMIMPFGKHKGQPLAEVPSEYLRWLTTIKLSPGLRTAVHTELAERGEKVPPAPLAKKPHCRRCGGHLLCLTWQELGGAGGRAIRADCLRCGRFVTYVAQTPENVAIALTNKRPTGLLDALMMADALGVTIVRLAGNHIELRPWGRASAELEALVRQNTHLLLRMLPLIDDEVARDLAGG
jgi:hypothetical protein